MADRTDFVLNITDVVPEDFYGGKKLSCYVPRRCGLQKDDIVRWKCGQMSGCAKVVSVELLGEDLECVFQKITGDEALCQQKAT